MAREGAAKPNDDGAAASFAGVLQGLEDRDRSPRRRTSTAPVTGSAGHERLQGLAPVNLESMIGKMIESNNDHGPGHDAEPGTDAGYDAHIRVEHAGQD